MSRVCNYSTKHKPRRPPSRVDLSSKLAGLQEKLQNLLADPSLAVAEHSRNETSPSSQGTSILSHRGSEPFLKSVSPVSNELSDDDREVIFNLFFQYQHRTASQIVQSNFAACLKNDNPNLRPHPALVNVIILNGIMFARLTSQTHLLPEATPDPTTLLPLVHRELESSLAATDRILDYIQASTLLAYWYFFHSRLQEAHYFSSSTFRLTMNCNLHRINEPIIREILEGAPPSSFWDNTILGRPKCLYELYQRVAIFWQCYTHDSCISWVAGLPTACDESTTRSITTIWPRPLADFESGAILHAKYLKSVKEFLAGDIDDYEPNSDDFLHTTRWKMIVLISETEKVSDLCSSFQGDDYEKWQELTNKVQSLAYATQRFFSTLPPMEGSHDDQNLDNVAYCTALVSHMGGCVARIRVIHSAEALARWRPERGMLLPNPASFSDTDFHAVISSLVSPEGGSFLSSKFATARVGIKLAYNAIFSNYNDDLGGDMYGSAPQLVARVANACGFMLAPMLLTVTEYTHSLEDQSEAKLNQAQLPVEIVEAMLEDARGTFEQGMEVMTLLSENLPFLTFNIDNVRQAQVRAGP